MPVPWHLETDAAAVRKICVGGFENNCYIVADRNAGKALVIDPAAEADRILRELEDLRCVAIAITHGHWDHVGAAAALASTTGAPIFIGPADAEMAGLDDRRPMRDGDVLQVGAVEVAAVATPGHTAGSTCLTMPGILFSGDTLFPGGPGATRGPGADFATIMASLEERIFTLPDRTLVLPGHGLDTTIGTERPSLPLWKARGW